MALHKSITTSSAVEAAVWALDKSSGDKRVAIDFLVQEPILREAQIIGLDVEGGLGLIPIIASLHSIDYMHMLRELLVELIGRDSPSWIKYASYGANAVFKRMTRDELQLFRNAGLDIPGKEVLEWWDRYATQGRSDAEARQLRFGRLAELWCYENEMRYLADPSKVIWYSFLDNTAGYDVLSQSEDGTPRHIEVKYIGGGSTVYLSRNEWDVACAKPGTWELRAYANENDYTALSHSQLKEKVPEDRNGGTWEVAQIAI